MIIIRNFVFSVCFVLFIHVITSKVSQMRRNYSLRRWSTAVEDTFEAQKGGILKGVVHLTDMFVIPESTVSVLLKNKKNDESDSE